MIYKNCIDACFDVVKAAERCGFECCHKESKESKECSTEKHCSTDKHCCASKHCCTLCADVCTLVGRMTARGFCSKDLYELCAKICDDCANHCGKVDHEYTKACALAAKKCADACRVCHTDCQKECGK